MSLEDTERDTGSIILNERKGKQSMDCRQVKGSLNSQLSVNLTEVDVQTYFSQDAISRQRQQVPKQKGHLEESSKTSTTQSKYICAVAYSISKCRVLHDH